MRRANPTSNELCFQITKFQMNSENWVGFRYWTAVSERPMTSGEAMVTN